jgi:hypothetical protein
MPFHVQCPGCLASAYIDCGCPDGHDAISAGHHADCRMLSVGAAVTCSCCPQDHDHDAAAGCDQSHDGDCGKDNPDCPVCRPVIITAMPGSARLLPAGG